MVPAVLREVSTTGPTQVAALAGGQISEFTISPADIGLDEVGIDALLGGTPDKMQRLRALLDGADGPYRDIVIFNAAAALVGGGHAAACRRLPNVPSLDEGRARRAWRRWTPANTPIHPRQPGKA